MGLEEEIRGLKRQIMVLQMKQEVRMGIEVIFL